MEIIVSAMYCELLPIQNYFGETLSYQNCGIFAKNLDFLKNLGDQDHVTNIGICGGKNIGEIYLCNEIIDGSKGKSYYPDILFDAKIKQFKIKTINYIADKNLIQKNPDTLYDQEASIIFKEAQKYISSHQISFLKIVSDNGLDEIKMSEKYVSNIIKEKISDIENYINLSKKFFSQIKVYNTNDEANKYSEIIKCSETMKNRIKQQLKYASICEIDTGSFFKTISDPKNKKESIDILNKFDSYLISKTN